MMTHDERVAYYKTMRNLIDALAAQTAVRETGVHQLIDNHFQFVHETDGTFVNGGDVEQMKKLADVYYTLAKAGLYREIDPEKLTPEMLDKIR